jgi:GT2 family glycosyltransferase
VTRTDLDDLDVVFLAWREAPAILARHHAAVAAALPSGWRGSAVLVENASPAQTSAAARDLLSRSYPSARRVVLRLTRNHGFGRAMNLALAECEGEYAALVNSDGRPEPGMFARLVAALEDDRDAVWAAPAVHEPDGAGARRGDGVEAVEELPGTALVMRRHAFLASGGFDPLFFFYSEDFDASRRIRDSGGRLLRVPGVAFHHGRDARSPRGQALREFLYAVGDQLRVHVHAPSRRDALRRIARSRPRAIAGKVSDREWPVAAGIAAATLAWPVTAALAERRRRTPWDGAALARWLERHSSGVIRTVLASPSSPPEVP